MLLSPNNRSLYTDALTPPGGYRLDAAVAATFSMDLTTLLAVPLQLVLQTTEDQQELMRDPIALYEALQRATSRVRIFVQRGRIQAPRQQHLLYGLLEPVITEVDAPRDGAFHAKLWALRFIRDEDSATQYRLLLPSKNLTTDRAWDVALTLEGVTGKAAGNCREIADFLGRLPELAKIQDKSDELFTSMIDELDGVTWELPDGFEQLKFHILGFGGRNWRPRRNRRLAVISPFIGAQALTKLASTSDEPVALVSRNHSLTEISGSDAFKTNYVLHDAAETDDGEDMQDESEIGLHAKIYLYQIANRTHIVLGSANATDAAMLSGKNVEILAELSGPSYKIGAVKKFFDPDADDGLGQYLVRWTADQLNAVDEGLLEAQRRLDHARNTLLAANLTLRCREHNEIWVLNLEAPQSISMPEIGRISAWPVTLGADKAVDAAGLLQGHGVMLPGQAMSSLTSLIAFRLQEASESLSFTLNLPVDGMPEERDRAILRSVVKNRDGFLRYLLLLLAGLGDDADVGTVARALSSGRFAAVGGSFTDMPLLEDLVRAFSRDRQRLARIERFIVDLSGEEDVEEILPQDFMDFWHVFRQALAGP